MLWALAGRRQTRRRQRAECGQLEVEEKQPGRWEGRTQQEVGGEMAMRKGPGERRGQDGLGGLASQGPGGCR